MINTKSSAKEVAHELCMTLGVLDISVPECREKTVEIMFTKALTTYGKKQRNQGMMVLSRLRELHEDDSYGACVKCYQPGTDDKREAWPCESVRMIDIEIQSLKHPIDTKENK